MVIKNTHLSKKSFRTASKKQFHKKDKVKEGSELFENKKEESEHSSLVSLEKKLKQYEKIAVDHKWNDCFRRTKNKSILWGIEDKAKFILIF